MYRYSYTVISIIDRLSNFGIVRCQSGKCHLDFLSFKLSFCRISLLLSNGSNLLLMQLLMEIIPSFFVVSRRIFWISIGVRLSVIQSLIRMILYHFQTGLSSYIVIFPVFIAIEFVS